MSEHGEQVLLCNWLELVKKQYFIEYFAIPNGIPIRSKSGSKNWGLVTKLKDEGVKTGVPDICILKDGKVLFIEMKRIKGGVVSANQSQWIRWLNTNKFDAYVCKGFEIAKKIIIEWATK